MNKINKQKMKGILRTVSVVFFSFIAALILGSIFILILGKNPIETYRQLIFSPFANMGNFGAVIRNMIPLTIVAVGVSFAGKCGLSNLGGDGQFLMGALAMIIVSTTIGKYLGSFSIVAGMVLGIIFGAICGGVAGFFRAKFKVSEIITTLMINYIVQYFIAWLDHGPMLKAGSSTPQTESVAEYERVPRIFAGTTFSYAIFIALICVIIYWIVIEKTLFGYKINALGGSVKAAAYGGIKSDSYYLKVMAISGAFSGFAGVVEICSFAYCVQDGISNDYGFNGLMVALLGLYSPWGILLAAFFFSLLSAGGNVMQVTCAVPATLVDMLRGLMILFILFGLSGKMKKQTRRFAFRVKRKSVKASQAESEVA